MLEKLTQARTHVLVSVCIMMASAHTTNNCIFAASFVGIGDLPGGQFKSDIRGMSPDGETVVGNSFSELSPTNLGEAFVWTRESGIQGLGHSPGPIPSGGGVTSGANAASNERQVIVGFTGFVDDTARLLRLDAFVLLKEEGFVSSVANADEFKPIGGSDVTPDGKIVVGNGTRPVLGSPNSENVTFRWTEDEGFRLLSSPTSSNGRVLQAHGGAISADGTVIAGTGIAVESEEGPRIWEAILWKADGSVISLGDLEGGQHRSTTSDISADGSVVIGQSMSERGAEGFYWTEATGMIGIGGVPGGSLSGSARAISADGNVLVGHGLDEDGSEAMIWDPIRGGRALKKILTEHFDLRGELQGWQLNSAVGISADGKTIVGNGVNPQGRQEGWVAVLDDLPDPELRPGDIDLDGAVSLSDFTILKEHFGIGGFRYQGDLDGDFDVDLEDFIIVKSHFGEGAAQVPEPATWVLLVIAIIGWLSCRAEARRCFGC